VIAVMFTLSLLSSTTVAIVVGQMMMFDLRLMIFIAPALVLALIAQIMVRSAYSSAGQVRAKLSGYAAARYVLDSAGLQGVDIEQTPGHLSDHYDPRSKVLRLSDEVYHGQSMAAVGIAAHEAGHAIQDAERYAPLGRRFQLGSADAAGQHSVQLRRVLPGDQSAGGIRRQCTCQATAGRPGDCSCPGDGSCEPCAERRCAHLRRGHVTGHPDAVVLRAALLQFESVLILVRS
jgi:hypothetical protein